jgi:SAM-dependent methyltransferase
MSEQSRWAAANRSTDAKGYAARFEELSASGVDIHGEATLVASLVPPGSRVLDAGCGTGRVAIRLAELGYHCVGVDSDAAMLDVAKAASTDVTWVLADLCDVDRMDESFDLVVAAGNVIPLVAPGSEAVVVARLAERLAPGGLLVAGFGLDAAHLPLAAAPFGLDGYDGWCVAAGLEPIERFATWDRVPFDGGGYAVSISRRA